MDWSVRLTKALETAVLAARQAGTMARDELPKLAAGDVKEKGRKDFVTRVDHASERMILEIIKRTFPQDAILSEETAGELPKAEHLWVVDPIDGTSNYFHRFPFYNVSIAYCTNGRPEVAAIYDPVHDELYSAKRNEGVWMNGEPIGVSDTRELAKAFVGSGLPARAQAEVPGFMAQFRAVLEGAGAVRRSGSAALDLAFVACGRYDAFWEPVLSPWDMAAGVLLVEAGGGMVTDAAGQPWSLSARGILAANPDLHGPLLKLLTTAG